MPQASEPLFFRGATAINLDNKGRFALPIKYRQEISASCQNQLVITIETQARCLLIYPLPQWRFIQEQLQSLPSFEPQTRRLQRLIIGHASDVEVDKAGRVLLAATLREYAQLDKKMMLVGQGNKLELWDETHWLDIRQQYLLQSENAALPEQLLQISL